VRDALGTVPEIPASARDGQAAIKFAVGLGDGAMEFLYAWLEGDTSEWPEFAPFAASPDIAPIGNENDTPPSDWIAKGKSDPHGGRYDCPRSALIGGDLTDDEVANAIYLDGSEKNLTIAKDRIRWLSRQLIAAKTSSAAAPPPPKPIDFRNEFINLIDSPTVMGLAKVFSPQNVDNPKPFSEQIVDVFMKRKSEGLPEAERLKIRNEIADAMRGDDEAAAIHREAASLFLFWPTQAIDLARTPETYPKFVTELAKFLARWEEKGRAEVLSPREA
jgi:hypothetical protein